MTVTSSCMPVISSSLTTMVEGDCRLSPPPALGQPLRDPRDGPQPGGIAEAEVHEIDDQPGAPRDRGVERPTEVARREGVQLAAHRREHLFGAIVVPHRHLELEGVRHEASPTPGRR